jgi:hypothetical protein
MEDKSLSSPANYLKVLAVVTGRYHEAAPNRIKRASAHMLPAETGRIVACGPPAHPCPGLRPDRPGQSLASA